MVGTSVQPEVGIPVAEMAENIVGCKWSVQVLRAILDEVRRLQEDVDRATINS